MSTVLDDVFPNMRVGERALLVLDGLKAHGKALAQLGLRCGAQVPAEGDEGVPRFCTGAATAVDLPDQAHVPLARIIRERGCVLDGPEGKVITVTFLPPRTSGLLQPADISVFGAMKQAWKNGGQLDLWKLHMEEVGADKARWSTFRDHIPYKDALAFLTMQLPAFFGSVSTRVCSPFPHNPTQSPHSPSATGSHAGSHRAFGARHRAICTAAAHSAAPPNAFGLYTSRTRDVVPSPHSNAPQLAHSPHFPTRHVESTGLSSRSASSRYSGCVSDVSAGGPPSPPPVGSATGFADGCGIGSPTGRPFTPQIG